MSRFAHAVAAALVTVTAAGCAQSPASSSAVPSAPAASAAGPSSAGPSPLVASSSPAASSAPVSLRFTVDGDAVDPPPSRRELNRGQSVEISVESTRDVEVHVHGFDLSGNAGPGKPAVIRFVADRTGSFDVEVHPDLLLVQLVVR